MADWYKPSLSAPRAGRSSSAGFRSLSISSSLGSSERSDGGGDATASLLHFTSRRSSLLCRKACVATSQPLASAIGYDILKQGGNAADTAIAVAAALAVVEPCSTGLGGDMFCLWYEAASKQISCINGSGPSPAGLTWERVQHAFPAVHENKEKKEGDEDDDDDGRDNDNQELGIDSNGFMLSALAVTVPGAAQGWKDLYDRHASQKFAFAELLEPAALLAEEGFPVAPVTAYHWSTGIRQVQKWFNEGKQEAFDDDTYTSKIPFTTPENKPPKPGDIIYNPEMARVLRDLGRLGPKVGFYKGTTGQAIASAVQKHGGCLTEQDLANYTSSTFPDPIAVEYRGCKLWQVPPNGQGIAGLIALAGMAYLEDKRDQGLTTAARGGEAEPTDAAVGSANNYHSMIEMMRLGFADVRAHVADLDHMRVSCEQLLDPERIGKRVETLFNPQKATIHGTPDASSCTVSFQVMDADGNAVSFVNSNYMGFGTGIVPVGCGFSLQNRGFGFALEKDHVNCIAPNKRPYHTIIPGMITHADTNELYATISNMGGNMQPQGHLQLTVGMLAGNLDPQTAIDMPRFCIVDGTQGGKVYLEEGVDEDVVEELLLREHLLIPNVSGHERSIFGKAQIIKRDRTTSVLWAGSDGRADGCAMGF